jgi:hypothetical protein
MKKRTFYLEPSERIAMFEGKKFIYKGMKLKKINGEEHVDKVIFEEITDKEWAEIQAKQKTIKKALAEKLDKEKVFDGIVGNMNLRELNTVHNMVKDKNVEIRPQEGCFGILMKDKTNSKRKRYFQISD